MDRRTLSDEALVSIWEDQREIKNLMGRYTRALLHKEEEEIPERFWSSREDISLGVNGGWYLGRKSVGKYYQYFSDKMALTDSLVASRFGGLKELQGAKGIGYLEMKALSTDLVEIAGDGKTAKGMWTCSGQVPEFTASGPVTHLTFGTYAVDFIREDGTFKIWHMQYLEEINHPQGEKWWESVRQRPELPEFQTLKDIQPPKPDVETVLWEKWFPGRGICELPPMPEAYETFEETFSYGFCGEVTA